MTGEIDIRRAAPADADAVADVWLRSFRAALPTVRRAHTDEEVHAWTREVLIPRRETWVATADGTVVAMMVLAEGHIDQLYIDPAYQQRGIGGRLVALAKQRSPDGLALWTFEVNATARRFYERNG